jgi:FHA domain
MPTMCPVCHERAAATGVLCAECCDELAPPIRAIPEQVQLHGVTPAEAALIDVWGRPHALASSTLIGRSVDDHGLAVLEASISRHHARIELEDGAWWVRDLASVNGTYVDDLPVEGAAALHAGARVRFGHMPFYFLPTGAQLSPQVIEAATVLIPSLRAEGSGELAVERAEFQEEERTDPGLPSIALRLHEPTGGGGGFAELEGKRIQLTSTQLELIAFMMRRMAEDADSPPLVRGFVRAPELIAALSWDTPEPNENHVKQLVRRVRRALMKVALGDLIESRHRFGYRLRAIPRDD